MFWDIAAALVGGLISKDAADSQPDMQDFRDNFIMQNPDLFTPIYNVVTDWNTGERTVEWTEPMQGLFDSLVGDASSGRYYDRSKGIDRLHDRVIGYQRSRYGLPAYAGEGNWSDGGYDRKYDDPVAPDPGDDPEEVPGGGPGNDDLIGDPLPPNGPDDGANPPGPDLTEPIQDPPTSNPGGGVNPGAGVVNPGDGLGNPYNPGSGWDNRHNPIGPLPGGDSLWTNSSAGVGNGPGQWDSFGDMWRSRPEWLEKAMNVPGMGTALGALTGIPGMGTAYNQFMDFMGENYPDGIMAPGSPDFLYPANDSRNPNSSEFIGPPAPEDPGPDFSYGVDSMFDLPDPTAVGSGRSVYGTRVGNERAGLVGSLGRGGNFMSPYNRVAYQRSANGGGFQGSMLPADFDNGDRYDMMPENPFERRR